MTKIRLKKDAKQRDAKRCKANHTKQIFKFKNLQKKKVNSCRNNENLSLSKFQL